MTVDYNDNQNLHNWVDRLGLACVPKSKVGMIGSAYFVGWVATLIFMPRLSDLYSRKWFYLIGMMVNLLIYTGLFLCTNINVVIVLVFLDGCTSTPRVTIGYVYLIEMVPKKWQVPVGTAWHIGESLCVVVSTIYW